MTPSEHEPLSQLPPAVRDYRVPEGPAGRPRFHLGDDLRRLDLVSRAGAPEAVIFYSARILEALADDALARLDQEPAGNAFANLSVLERLNLLPTTTRYWAHALRRLGNRVRHVRGLVGPEDAALSALFLDRWLHWFFTAFPFGPRLAALTADGRPPVPTADRELAAFVGMLEEMAGGDPDRGWLARAETSDALLRTPVLPAVLAEVLLGRNDLPDALRVLTAGLARYPDDLRLRQLRGLYDSRRGDGEQALAWLEPLGRQYPDDDETAGITAGVSKRLWLADRRRLDRLEQAHRGYRAAWKRSQRKNAYLGVNAATTALWLGRPDAARALAGEVSASLRALRTALARFGATAPAMGYWDQVTLAEAELLLGHTEEARRLYAGAFAEHRDRPGDVETTRGQLHEILRALGRDEGPDRFLAGEAGPR